MKASDDEFKRIRDFIYKVCGILIKEDKRYLIEQRLEPVIRKLGMSGFSEFAKDISGLNALTHRSDVIEAITTNETSFFRDVHPFQTFRNYLLPELGKLLQARQGRLGGPKVTIWCAASSTGQEPYSLAMMVRDYVVANSSLGLSFENFSILATDISTEVLEKANQGRYTGLEVSRGLSPELKAANFVKDGGSWVIRDEVKKIVEFKKLNITEPFQHLGTFDLIFCRNMLIYFDDETKRRIFLQFRKMLPESGILVLGACENINFVSEDFKSFYHNQTILYACA